MREFAKPVKRATEIAAMVAAARLRGLENHLTGFTQGSAALHPGLYASACSAGSLNGSTQDRCRVAEAVLRNLRNPRNLRISI